MRLLDGRSYAYQWDSNIYVILPKAKMGEEIHFAHRKDKKALVMTAIEIDSVIVAEVPNLLLQRAGFIQVYHFISDKKGNRTINRDELKVLEREKPDDYLYEESEIWSWEYLDKRISALESTQPDWDQNNPSQKDYIKNKPLIATNDDTMDFLAEMEMTTPVTNSNGEILISQSNEIYSL